MARKYSEKRRRAKVAIARLNRARRGTEKEAPEKNKGRPLSSKNCQTAADEIAKPLYMEIKTPIKSLI